MRIAREFGTQRDVQTPETEQLFAVFWAHPEFACRRALVLGSTATRLATPISPLPRSPVVLGRWNFVVRQNAVSVRQNAVEFE